jgi:hypothetical protein
MVILFIKTRTVIFPTNEDLFFTDLMAGSKLTPYADYTYATKKLAYRSILDRVFTTIGKQHCNPTAVLDWGENFSDHRLIQISIDLNSLCDGWLDVTVHMLDGMGARTMTYYNDSSLR